MIVASMESDPAAAMLITQKCAVFATMSSDEFKNEQKNNPPRLREGLYTLTLIPSHFVSIQCVFDLFGILSANLHL